MAQAPADRYASKAARARLRSRTESRAGRDIGDIPPVANSARKVQAIASFKFFCETYLSRVFTLAWSSDHLRVIAKIERAVLEGGLFAMAMPRGNGKTKLCEAAGLWAMLTGARRFPFLIGSTEAASLRMLDNIKQELSSNELLLEDFPEVVYPIRRLEGEARRCAGQLHHGQPTCIEWGSSMLVLPTIPGSRASASRVLVSGITGNIRGWSISLPGGGTMRPDLVLIDDPQTDESARSPSQCEAREATIKGAILGLAGPGQKIAGLAAVTVIQAGDLADRLLDRTKHPEWQGERTKMLKSLPTNLSLWAEYGAIWAESLRTNGDIRDATAFYAAHRAEMDAGAEASWPERFNHDELSAIQNAMNLRLRDERAFMAEYQNEPTRVRDQESSQLTAENVLDKNRLSMLERRALPTQATTLVGGIDVQGHLLYYWLTAVSPEFSLWGVDYGSEPEQDEEVFTLRDARRTFETMRDKYGASAGAEGLLYAAIRSLQDAIMRRDYRTADGTKITPERILIDANYGPMSDVVYQACADSPHTGVFTPSHGKGVGASSAPMTQWADREGMRKGLHWQYGRGAKRREVRHAMYDTNFWKSFAAARVRTAIGERGCVRLFGRDINRHRMLADHLSSEYAIETQGRARTVQQWAQRPGHDNHLWDCFVQSCVAASIQGCVLKTTDAAPPPPPRRKLMTVAEYKAEAERRRRAAG